LRAACKSTQANSDIDLILADFGEFLNAEQLSYFALKYLQSSSTAQPEVQNIKHRIFNSQPQLQSMFPKPQPAFVVEQIRVQMSASHSKQQHAGQPGR